MNDLPSDDKERRILVTGVAGFWGRQVAARLIEWGQMDANRKLRLIGIDSQQLREPLRELDFVQADVRNRLLAELIGDEGIETICHLQFKHSSHKSEANFDANVMGTMKLLGVAAEAGVQKVILKSSLQVYGARIDNPAFLSEECPIQGNRGYGYLRDLIEIENYCGRFHSQWPTLILTILRFASILGPECDTPLARFLTQPFSPSLLGFDPMMQVIHQRDVVEAILHAVLNDKPGNFNIAAPQSLPLSKLMRLAGKVNWPLFHPLAYLGSGLSKSIGISRGRYLPLHPDYLRYTWVGDLSKMQSEFGFTPVYSAQETLREFASQKCVSRFKREAAGMGLDEDLLRDILERRRRMRQEDASQE